ncbi:hypothetical protein [Emticicia sp. 17c]|uniref:hypothetical protein n=1 Tax=Emticicia sp. 17c TaxID=3127704 RepID=UPI00301DFDBE
MLVESDDILLAHCKNLIEEKLNWGKSENWANQDFEELSQRIFEVTTVTLSPTTLKRIWGKVKYDSAPTITTLNTLAQFVGFEHWRAFRQSHSNKIDIPEPILTQPEAAIQQSKRQPYVFSFILPVILALGAISWYFISKADKHPLRVNADDYTFSSKKVVAVGVPNSVIFDYDATKAPNDSVYIQQSWDSSKRTKVSRNQHQHTSIYYYPGLFQAKLVVNNQIVQEQTLFIKTDGWLPMVEQSPVPVYFKQAEAISNGKLGLSLNQILAHNISLQPTAPTVYYANLRDFGDVRTNNFIFETSLKNTYREGASICQYTEIGLLCEGSAITLHLSAKGCVSENNLFFVDKYISGKEHDLSGLGVDFSNFVKLRCESVNGQVKIYVNNQLAYQFAYTGPASKIVGITYRFQGGGLVDDVKLLQGDKKPIYEDTFMQ